LHYSLRKTGIPVGVPRLPLVDLMPESKKKVDEVLRNLKLIE
jgi:dihydrodipicolinate synthase/N-acetylneuraminate lyase